MWNEKLSGSIECGLAFDASHFRLFKNYFIKKPFSGKIMEIALKSEENFMKKPLKIFVLLVLFVNASFIVSGQTGGVIGVGLFTGVESSPAVCEMTIAACFGNTFVLSSFGEHESQHLTVSVNYYNSMPNGGNGFTVTGGTWSLVVMRDGQYAGTLYGQVENGAIIFPQSNQGGNEKITDARLKASGGLGIFNTGRSKKSAEYELKMTTDLMTKQTVGRLDAVSQRLKNSD